MMNDNRILVAVLGGCALLATGLALRPGGHESLAPGEALPRRARRRARRPSRRRASAPTATSTFNGMATVTVRPDSAHVQVSAEGEGDSSKAALQASSRKMHAIVSALEGLGIKGDDLQTSGVYTYKDYEQRGQWHATNSLDVKIDDADRAGQVMSALAATGADGLSGPSFGVDDQRAAYRQALRASIEDARAKADATAAAMDVRVTGVVSVTETGGTPSYPMAMEAAARDSAGQRPHPEGQPGRRRERHRSLRLRPRLIPSSRSSRTSGPATSTPVWSRA